MTKVVFIASALFLLSIVFKSNLQQGVQTTDAQAPTQETWADKVADIASGINELLASDPAGAGQIAKTQGNKTQLPSSHTTSPSKLVVREELVDPTQLGSIFTQPSNSKSVSMLPPASGGIKPPGLPTSAVPFATNPIVNGASSSLGNSNNATTGNSATASRQLSNVTNDSRRATAPFLPSTTDTQSSPDTIPKVTEQAGKFYVQYGIFTSACRSEQVKDKLAQAGIYSVMDKLDPEGEQWIVQSKPYVSRAEAVYNLQLAQRKGYESYLVNAN